MATLQYNKLIPVRQTKGDTSMSRLLPSGVLIAIGLIAIGTAISFIFTFADDGPTRELYCIRRNIDTGSPADATRDEVVFLCERYLSSFTDKLHGTITKAFRIQIWSALSIVLGCLYLLLKQFLVRLDQGTYSGNAHAVIYCGRLAECENVVDALAPAGISACVVEAGLIAPKQNNDDCHVVTVELARRDQAIDVIDANGALHTKTVMEKSNILATCPACGTTLSGTDNECPDCGLSLT